MDTQMRTCPNCRSHMLFYPAWGPTGTYECKNCKRYWRETPAVLLPVEDYQIEKEIKNGLRNLRHN